jgi:hypothetical protein
MEMLELLAEIQKESKALAKIFARYQRAKEGEDLKKVERFLVYLKKGLEGIKNPYLKELGERFYREVSESLKKEKEVLRERFGWELKELLAKEGKVIRGQYPDLRIGPLTLEVNFDTNLCHLYWGNKVEVIRRKMPLKPPLILKTIQEFYRTLSVKDFNPQVFARHLFTAYCQFLSANRCPEADRVFLVDLLPAIAFLIQGKDFREDPRRKNFKEYPRYRFSYDLYQLKNSGLREIEGYTFFLSVATFDQTLEKRKALWVPINEEGEGVYYSTITFKK